MYGRTTAARTTTTARLPSIRSTSIDTLLLMQQITPLIRFASRAAAQASSPPPGIPVASVTQFDLGFFAQDDWRCVLISHLSMGLRYETQNNIGDRKDFGPRIGIAWGLGGGGCPRPCFAGDWIFYDRFTEDSPAGQPFEPCDAAAVHRLQSGFLSAGSQHL